MKGRVTEVIDGIRKNIFRTLKIRKPSRSQRHHPHPWFAEAKRDPIQNPNTAGGDLEKR